MGNHEGYYQHCYGKEKHMKKFSKICAVLLALCMIISLAACGSGGGGQTPQTSAAQEETTDAAETVTQAAPTEAETEAPAETVAAGTFSFNYVDPYGDTTAFTITTKDTGKVFVTLDGPVHKGIVHADTWTDNGDGTITIGPLDEELELEFLEADGSSIWAIDGEAAVPVNYTEPTEFIERENTAPMSAAAAVGVYTFGFINAYGVTVPYVVSIKADGTADITMISAWVGPQAYHAGKWEYVPDSKVKFTDMTWDGEEPKTDGNGAVWFADGTYESTWVLDGDGNCVPEGYDGEIGEIDLTTLDPAIYPTNADKVGVYTFGFVNAYGVTVPYVVSVKADHTADIYMVSAWVGTQAYHAGHWGDMSQDSNGTISFVDMTWDGEEPRTEGNGAVWFAEGTYESTWILNADGTCVPMNYEGDVGEIDVTTLDPAIYPQ